MKFRYKKFTPKILRPVIPITISHYGLFIQYEVLVDSGADQCIFDAELADLLNLDLFSGRKEYVGGITGAIEEYFIHHLELTVGGFTYQTDVGFLPKIARSGYGVVGQKGFFDQFVVKFDLSKAEVELKLKR